MSTLRLEVGRSGHDTNVFIDGEQVWNVTRVTFTVAADELPSAIIEWHGDIEVTGDIEVQEARGGRSRMFTYRDCLYAFIALGVLWVIYLLVHLIGAGF